MRFAFGGFDQMGALIGSWQEAIAAFTVGLLLIAAVVTFLLLRLKRKRRQAVIQRSYNTLFRLWMLSRRLGGMVLGDRIDLLQRPRAIGGFFTVGLMIRGSR